MPQRLPLLELISRTRLKFKRINRLCLHARLILDLYMVPNRHVQCRGKALRLAVFVILGRRQQPLYWRMRIEVSRGFSG